MQQLGKLSEITTCFEPVGIGAMGILKLGEFLGSGDQNVGRKCGARVETLEEGIVASGFLGKSTLEVGVEEGWW